MGQTYFAYILIATAGLTAAKSSVLFFYLRILTGRWIRIACWVTGILGVLWFISCVLAMTLACQPIGYFWNKFIPGRCVDTIVVNMGVSGTSGVIDIMTVLIPLPTMWKLNLTLWHRRIIIYIVIAAGL